VNLLHRVNYKRGYCKYSSFYCPLFLTSKSTYRTSKKIILLYSKFLIFAVVNVVVPD